MADDLTNNDLNDESEGPEGPDDDVEVLVDADEVLDDEFPDTDDTDTDDTDPDDDDDDAGEVVVDEVVTPARPKGTKAKPPASGDEEESGEEDDDEPDPDDVEADLDTILKDRLVVADDDDDEDEEEALEPEDKGEASKVRPRAPGEFVCQSCFLVKHPSQLADETLLLCRDCV